jgi:UDP-N-acetylglucosamine 2-epimerase (non-hydrolysing)
MKILSVVAARPNFVKLASVVHALKAYPKVRHVIVHTGQHYDPLFSDVFFEQLALPLPAHNLDVRGGERKMVIDNTSAFLLPVLHAERPDMVLVYGDVNGALGAAQAANTAGIPLAHIEAGLRSFDDDMPEEHNRRAIDRLSSILFCTEQSGVTNLKKERVHGSIHLVGNTMIDTLFRMMPFIDSEPLPISTGAPYAVVTMHRPSNVDYQTILKKNLAFLGEVAERMTLVLPVHHRLREALKNLKKTDIHPSIRLIDPLGYIPFLRLCKSATFLLTDSGGIQEEAVILAKRCFTMRRNTERPVTIESGSNVLIDPEKIADRDTVLAFAEKPLLLSICIPPFWDGKAGARILTILLQ